MYNPKDMFLVPNLKGIAMLGVLIAHTSINSEILRSYIELFAMPIFAFFAGYAIKKSESFDFSYVRRIIVIYLTANLSYFVLRLPLSFRELDWIYVGRYLLYPNVVILWFLVSLILWYVVYKLVSPISKFKFCIFVLLSAVAFTFRECDDPIGILHRTIRFFPFYLMATMFDADRLSIIRYSKKKYFIVPISIFAFATVGLFVRYDLVSNIYLSVLTLIMSLACVYSLLVLIPGRRIPLLSKTGFNSLTIYVWGFLFQIIANKLILRLHLEGLWGSILVVLLNLATVALVLLLLNRDFFIRRYNTFVAKAENFLFPMINCR